MRKHKIIIFTAVLLFTPSFIIAEQDLTTKYIKNPSFEQQTESWTVDNMGAQTNAS